MRCSPPIARISMPSWARPGAGTADVIRLTADHPQKDAIRAEVPVGAHPHRGRGPLLPRGAGNFVMHVDGRIYDAHCTRGRPDLACRPTPGTGSTPARSRTSPRCASSPTPPAGRRTTPARDIAARIPGRGGLAAGVRRRGRAGGIGAVTAGPARPDGHRGHHQRHRLRQGHAVPLRRGRARRLPRCPCAMTARSPAILAEVRAAAPGEEPRATLRRWMAEDAKVTPLKTLQGLIWRAGYLDGRLRGHLWPDVAPCLRAWARGRVAAGGLFLRLGRGAAAAVRPFRGGRPDAAVRRLLRHHGRRASGTPASYAAIAAGLQLPPGEVLFLSDVAEELDAAAAAGLQMCQLVRAGDGTQPCGRHPRRRTSRRSPGISACPAGAAEHAGLALPAGPV